MLCKWIWQKEIKHNKSLLKKERKRVVLRQTVCKTYFVERSDIKRKEQKKLLRDRMTYQTQLMIVSILLNLFMVCKVLKTEMQRKKTNGKVLLYTRHSLYVLKSKKR